MSELTYDLMLHHLQSIDGHQIILFTTSTANAELVQFLSDDFNFEICMRKLSLKDQLKVRNSQHNRIKELGLRLFSKYVLNYIVYIQGGSPSFDPWAELPMEYNKYGKPQLKNQNFLNFQYNSSSSNDIISIVVLINSSSSVGIDLSHETQDSISATEFMDQFQGIFTSHEQNQLMKIDNIEERYVAFNHFWTLKEAFTKFIGCGLNVDLAKISFHLTDEKLELRGSIPSEKGLVTGYNVKWLEGIKVEYSELADEFRTNFNHHHYKVYCSSAVLRAEDKLPVIVTVISPHDNIKKSKNFHFDMGRLVEGLVDTDLINGTR